MPLDSTLHRLQQYLKQFPENADAWMLAGNMAYLQADYTLAINNYRNAIARQPTQSLYYSALGAVYNVQNKPDSAQKYLEKAILLGDSSAYTYLNTALLYIKINNKTKSLAWADKAANNQKQIPSPVISAGISFIYYKWKDEENSEKWLQKAMQLGLKDTFAFRQVLNGNKELEVYYRETYPYL
ncbi:MAG TPA: tetratricopeptide repeat protein [Chitinophagales bacterium]|nr:tetratricopeptide repeat protein [Chitinophagales bacterium]